MNKNKIPKGQYAKNNLIKYDFYDRPTTSIQDIVCLNINSTSDDTSYPTKKYDYVKNICNGSIGRVTIALDKSTGEYVVIKELPKKRHERRTEIKVLKYLSDKTSARILKYIECFESQRISHLVTEYHKGYNLFDHIDGNCPYYEPKAYKILLEMAYCIKECHDINVVHFDIKCENFMVTKEHLFENGRIKPGTLVLVDFGHADILESPIDKVRYGMKYGTPYYVCPERNFSMYSSASDIWSLGVCFALIITGSFPYRGFDYNYRGYYDRVMNSEFTFKKDITEMSQNLIKKMLHPNPKKRPIIDDVIREIITNMTRFEEIDSVGDIDPVD